MKILVYIDNHERLQFFTKIVKELDLPIVFITNKLSIYYKLDKDSKKYLLRKKGINYNYKVSEEFPKTYSVLSGYHSYNQSKEIYKIFYTNLEEILETEKFNKVFIWNGSTTMGYTLSEFCIKNKIDIYFFEISNLKGKVFIDKKGVNAKSSLYVKPEILDTLEVDEKKYEIWFSNFKNEQDIKVQQAKNKSKIKIDMILDYFGYSFKDVLQEDFRNPFLVLKNKLINKINLKTKNYDTNKEFIFFPLQVSNDSQLYINSDIDNLELINILLEKYPKKLIYLKIHPAEADKKFINKLYKIISKHDNLKIVSNSTRDLLNNATKTVVINSTVGLEAMILNKNIEIYGRAIYSKFNNYRLKSYIQKYLINIDYFNDDKPMSDEINKLLDFIRNDN